MYDPINLLRLQSTRTFQLHGKLYRVCNNAIETIHL